MVTFLKPKKLRTYKPRILYISVIQVRMDQGLVVKIRCPMRS